MSDQIHYYKATRVLLEFLESIDGSYERFAREVGCSSKTIARLRNGKRVSRDTMNSVLKTAQSQGFKGSKEGAFVTTQGDDEK